MNKSKVVNAYEYYLSKMPQPRSSTFDLPVTEIAAGRICCLCSFCRLILLIVGEGGDVWLALTQMADCYRILEAPRKKSH